jgi:hypothetical protein
LSCFLLSGKQSFHLPCKCCFEFLHFGIDNILHIHSRKAAQLLIIHVLYRFLNNYRVVQSESISIPSMQIKYSCPLLQAWLKLCYKPSLRRARQRLLTGEGADGIHKFLKELGDLSYRDDGCLHRSRASPRLVNEDSLTVLYLFKFTNFCGADQLETFAEDNVLASSVLLLISTSPSISSSWESCDTCA